MVMEHEELSPNMTEEQARQHIEYQIEHDKLEKHKKEIKDKILDKINSIIESQREAHFVNHYKRTMTAEIMINAKDFCNHFREFYNLGLVHETRHLLILKSLVLAGKVTIPIPLESDPSHCITIQA